MSCTQGTRAAQGHGLESLACGFRCGQWWGSMDDWRLNAAARGWVLVVPRVHTRSWSLPLYGAGLPKESEPGEPADRSMWQRTGGDNPLSRAWVSESSLALSLGGLQLRPPPPRGPTPAKLTSKVQRQTAA